MANVMYPKGREKFLAGDIDWASDDIKVVALDDTYTYDDADEFLDDLTGTIATSGNLASKTTDDPDPGIADAADVSLGSPALGDTIESIVIYKDTGSAATSPLIAFMDTRADTTPIEVETTGGEITIVWNPGLNRIFKL